VGLFGNKQKDELVYQIGKLRGMEQRLDPNVLESPQAKALCVEIRTQAEHCLDLLEKFEANFPRGSRRKLEAEWAPVKDGLAKTMLLYHAASGEWEDPGNS
jgi:hypothetical protein